MPLFPLRIPPGVSRRGTAYQEAGRVYDASLVRPYGKTWGPIGGWVERDMDPVTGSARAIIAWKDNAGSRWGAVGTHSRLYAFNSDGDLTDITPSGFTSGRASGTAKTGYGYGLYGAGVYGAPRPDSGEPLPATVWDLDTWGEYLVSVSDSDGKLYEWDVDTGNDAAAITNAPTGCTGLVVTPDTILMALAPGGNPRKVAWTDIRDNTNWTAGSTSKAGDIELQTAGQLMCGRRVPGGTLILTDLDAWLATYIGDVFIFRFDQVGPGNCGIQARGAIAQAGALTAWWGRSGFWMYDGGLRQIPCDVIEYLQANLNTAQKSKITASHNAQFNEIVWDYPSVTATENDSYAAWHYPTADDPESYWTIGSRSRTAAMGPGIFRNPIAIDASGQAYDHEIGGMYDGDSPYLIVGPQEIGTGDSVVTVDEIISDADNVGDVTLGFLTRFYPDADETEVAQITLSSAGKSDCRFTARQVSVKAVFGSNNAARLGTNRFNVKIRGRR